MLDAFPLELKDPLGRDRKNWAVFSFSTTQTENILLIRGPSLG
jgi:hypothetical protein